MALRVELNEGGDIEKSLPMVLCGTEILKACAFIKEMTVSSAGLRIKIVDDDARGDHTAEFQQVLCACEEHISGLRFHVLPNGLFIKFPSEDGTSQGDEESDDEKKFKLVVKSPDLDRHEFFEINSHTTTVLMMKDMTMRPTMLDPDYDEAKGEDEILAISSTLEMFNTEMTKELDNFSYSESESG